MVTQCWTFKAWYPLDKFHQITFDFDCLVGNAGTIMAATQDSDMMSLFK